MTRFVQVEVIKTIEHETDSQINFGCDPYIELAGDVICRKVFKYHLN